jgi:transposase-like protein
MTRYAPGSQSRAMLAEKERLAGRLLDQGLTVTQICQQLRCSPHFVRQTRQKLSQTLASERPPAA